MSIKEPRMPWEDFDRFKTLINKGFPRLEDFTPIVWRYLLNSEILILCIEGNKSTAKMCLGSRR